MNRVPKTLATREQPNASKRDAALTQGKAHLSLHALARLLARQAARDAPATAEAVSDTLSSHSAPEAPHDD